DLVGIARVRGLVEGDVLRDVHHHRAGTAAAGDVEGLLHHLGEVAHVLHQEVVLDDGTGDADRVALLEGVHADGGGGHLAGDDHHRDRIHVGGGDAGHGVRHARAGGHQRHADVAGRAGVAVGGVHGGLLVAHQNVLDRVLLVERVVDVQHRAAGIAPDEPHVL